MRKNKIWNMLALAGSFVVLVNSQILGTYAAIRGFEEEYVVEEPEQCRRLLMELVSGFESGTRCEVLVTGKNYRPETLTIARMFPGVINISNTVLKEYREGEHQYMVCRIGFEKGLVNAWDENEESGDVTMNGDKPPDYFVDEDTSLDRHWSVGDRKTWKIGEERYVFQCIDDDYGSNSGYPSCALFLCETVIRSDVDSTESKREILTFGRTNNYKTSEVRTWLQENLIDDGDDLVSVDIGVESAYLGATAPGTYEDCSTTGLWRHDLGVQVVEDELFLLSLEEALKYREVLWDVDGGNTPYSHGYWLRTPAYEDGEDGEFCYGNWVYAVDLEEGCIAPEHVQDGSIGIRPAFCLPQV